MMKKASKKVQPTKRKFSLPVLQVRPTILPLLNERVFHVTRYSSFKQIMGDGFIFPNGDGRYGSAFSSSKGNYGNFKDYICLFDFRNKEPQDIEDATMKCNFLEGDFLGNRVAFLFIKNDLHGSLIHQDTMEAEVGFTKRYVPYVECWSHQPIPTNMIEEVLDVTIKRGPRRSPWSYLADLPVRPGLAEELKQARERVKRYREGKEE